MGSENFIDKYLTESERSQLSNAKFGNPVGIGERPALVLIDVQNYMSPPSAVLTAARATSIPVFHTQFVLSRDGKDIGVYGRKRALLNSEGWCLEGSIGAEFIEETAPLSSEISFVKKKPSAFFGTPLLSYLVDRNIDSLIVMGGSTSNCVRATVIDAMSNNFRVTVVADAVFDRFKISHDVALFEFQRQYADVISSHDVIKHIGTHNDK